MYVVYVLIQNAAKMVDACTQTKRTLRIPNKAPAEDISLNDSLISMQSDDTDRDPECTPDDEMEYKDEVNDSDTIAAESNKATEKKFIVFESCLDDLLRKCVQFGCDGLISRTTIGTCVVVSVSCLKCEFVRTWNSQPMTDTMPYGNLIISAAMLFSGVSHRDQSNFTL